MENSKRFIFPPSVTSQTGILRANEHQIWSLDCLQTHVDTPTPTPHTENKQRKKVIKHQAGSRGGIPIQVQRKNANVLGFNNAIGPDRTRPACLVPFEMVTKQRLRDEPKQASLSLQRGGRGRGCLDRTKGLQTPEDKKTYGGWGGGKMVALGRLRGRFIPEQIQPSLCYRRKKQLTSSTDVSRILTETQWAFNLTCWTGSRPLTRARNRICHVDGYLRSVLASPEGFGAVKFNPDATTRQS